ncbi:hypothetical protein ACVIGA_005772 [Bradyrhizobium sp. USDA 3240]
MAQHESIEISQPNCSSLRWSELLALLLTHYTLERPPSHPASARNTTRLS